MLKHSLSPAKWNIILFSVAALIVAIDQWTKWLIQSNLYPGQSIPETGFFRLSYAQNTGAAFSIFLGGNDILAIVSILGIILILVYNFYLIRRYPFLNSAINKIAIALILGGTVGNLVDRLSLHYVRDFIDLGPWPIFNVADSCTVVGTILFAISILFFSHDLGTKEAAGKAGPSNSRPPSKIK
jgi:signal peptidase II